MFFYRSLSSPHPSLSRTDGIHCAYCKCFLLLFCQVVLSGFQYEIFIIFIGYQRCFAAIAIYIGKIGSILPIESLAAFVTCLKNAEISIARRLFFEQSTFLAPPPSPFFFSSLSFCTEHLHCFFSIS